MRRIEEEMLSAIEHRRNFSKSNTKVSVSTNGYIYVYLHRNCICKIAPNGIRYYSNCGWSSNTTKSRLNALGADIHQKDWEWYHDDGSKWENEF